MRHDVKSIIALLSSAPARSVQAILTRLVPFPDLVRKNPPDWLHTSGKPNRYNPAGIECVYFSEERVVAHTEYEEMWKGLAGENQPVTTFFAEVSLRRVLDLTDNATLKALKVDPKELLKSWRLAISPTWTQHLGQAVNESGLFSAIRYPSKAASNRGQAGVNYVIFRKCVRHPDFVYILGQTKKPLQQWP